MRPFIIILLSFLIPVTVFAQCKDSVLTKPWGKWQELQYNSNVYKVEHHQTDSVIPAEIRTKLREALIRRCGENFYSALRISELMVVIPLQEKRTHEDLMAQDLHTTGEIKYYYNYIFYQNPGIEYRFNIALDISGNMLTEWPVPEISKNSFSRIITLCEAVEIARKDKKSPVQKINDAILIYDPHLNYFGWKVTIGIRTQNGKGHFETYRIAINAITSRIIDRWPVELKIYDNPNR